MAANDNPNLRWYSTREPVILMVLTAIAVVFFLLVSLLSRVYHDRQASQAEKWYRRATQDQRKGYLDRAIVEFQAAELHSQGNSVYQLGLAQTLADLGRTDEAYSYLINLREQQPENGVVNLELARIFAKRGDAATAIRYYHNALYATWPPNAENQRLAGRFELIEFLLRENDKTQAQAELIALAANLPSDPDLHARAGELFFQSRDYEHSLIQYQEALQANHHDPVALKGAGKAAFELAQYSQAQHYLQAAVDTNPADLQSAELLQTTELVLNTDPFVRRISVSERRQIVVVAFAAAGQRLKSCRLSNAGEPLDTQWKELKPRITKLELRQNPDLVDTAMNLVFAIEQAASVQCGEPAGVDMALLLIAKLHGGGER